MLRLSDLTAKSPVVPYIREADYAERNPWFIAQRRLLDYLLIYIQEGECIVIADGVSYRCTSGEFCLLQPESLFTLEGTTQTITPYAHLDIFYNPDREQSFPTRAGQVDLAKYTHLIQPRLNDLEGIELPVKIKPSQPIVFRNRLLDMIRLWLKNTPLSLLEAQCIAAELIVTLLKDYTGEKEGTSHPKPTLNWISSFFSFHLSENLSVAEMAKRANLSPSRFSHVFRNRFGMPPYRYFIRLRIEHAKELLATTELTLDDIAKYCGFADIHHFSKSFKQYVGLTPGAYRSEHRGGAN